MVYQATVQRLDNNSTETYVGLTENQFKSRYNAHQHTFREADLRNSTELSKYIHTLKDDNVNYSVKWKILKKCNAYSNSSKKCFLCLYEKYIIVCKPNLCSLNRRTELMGFCRHKGKFRLDRFRVP